MIGKDKKLLMKKCRDYRIRFGKCVFVFIFANHIVRYLVVEYKGLDRWGNPDSDEKRALGALWSERSSGKYLFVMPRGKDWQSIREIVE